jgi:hypothetical protein
MTTPYIVERSYEFVLEGLHLSTPTRISVSDLNLQHEIVGTGIVFPPGAQSIEAELSAAEPPSLSVRVTNANAATAAGYANRAAALLYQRLLLRFGDRIERAEPPRLVGSTPPMPTATGGTALLAGSMELEELARDVEIRLMVAELPTSAPLYNAIEMYTVALQSANKVVRFLVLYSALSLAALFKWHNGRQEKVDALLLEVQPTLTRTPSSTTGKNETLYTKLRNDFIHAEERGHDVANAIAAIEAHTRPFQQLVTAILPLM